MTLILGNKSIKTKTNTINKMLRFTFLLILLIISNTRPTTALLDFCLTEIDSSRVLKYFDECSAHLTSHTNKSSAALRADVVNIVNTISSGNSNTPSATTQTVHLFMDLLSLYELLTTENRPQNSMCAMQKDTCQLLFGTCEFQVETDETRLSAVAVSAARLAAALTAYSINEEKDNSRFLAPANLATSLKLLMQEQASIYDAKLVFKSKKQEEFKEIHVWKKKNNDELHSQNSVDLANYDDLKRHAWFHHWDRADALLHIPPDSYPDHTQLDRIKHVSGVTFDCELPTLRRQISLPFLHSNGQVRGILLLAVSLDSFDLFQCGLKPGNNQTANSLLGTDKCDPDSTMCVNVPDKGFHLDTYTCQCRPGFYAANTTTEGKATRACHKCLPGCTTCADSRPCRIQIDDKLKQVCLFINLVLIVICIVLIVVICYHMSRKMLNSSSPEMLIMVLVGAIVSYCELIPMYFEASRLTCTGAQVLQLLGFLLAYGALVLKTWRECKLFYVRSIKTMKITEKSLLKRLGLVMLVGAAYLGFWAVRADSPREIEARDVDGLKYLTCTVTEWNYISLLIQFAVLSYGVVQSIHVRRASIAFKETKLITWAIFNECFFKIVNVLIMIFVIQSRDLRVYVYFPFLHAFLRTHLTVSIMVMLIFIYKIYTIVVASKKPYQSNQSALLNNFNTIGGNDGEAKNSSACEEKETEKEKELKIEIMRLCRQLEETRSLSMRIANPHLLTKKSRFISYPNKKAKTKYLLPLDSAPDKNSGEACLAKMSIEEATDKVKA